MTASSAFSSIRIGVESSRVEGGGSWRVAMEGAPIGLPEERMRCLSLQQGEEAAGPCQPRAPIVVSRVADIFLAAPLAIFKGLTNPQSLRLRADR